MLLWNRQLTISPDSFNAGMAGMVDAVTHVNSVSDYEFALWAPVLGTFGEGGHFVPLRRLWPVRR